MTAHPSIDASGLPAPILLLGCGEVNGGDDAAGLVLAKRLMRTAAAEMDVWTNGRIPWYDELARREAILLIDSVITGGPAGTIHLATLPSPDIHPRHLGEIAGSQWDVEQMIRFALERDVAPPRVALIAFEVEQLQQSVSPSLAVSAAIHWAEAHFDMLLTLIEATEGDIVRLIPPSFTPKRLRFELRPEGVGR